MKINKHLNKNNLHHAYLIEGSREEIEKEIIEFIKELGINISGNADFSHISVDSFKIQDARNLKAFSVEKATSNKKRIFLISTNNFLLQAQNSLLKMFEEPIENTHFFLIVPDASVLLKTFVSRFYLISTKQNLTEEFQEIEKFILMSLRLRLNFIKELLVDIVKLPLISILVVLIPDVVVFVSQPFTIEKKFVSVVCTRLDI